MTLIHRPFLPLLIFHLKEDLNELIASMKKELGGFPLNVASFSPHARKFYARNFN